MKWIKVEDKMPETGEEVLVYIKYADNPFVAYYNGKWYSSYTAIDWMTDGYSTDSKLQESPTHWMPLPKPPKE